VLGLVLLILGGILTTYGYIQIQQYQTFLGQLALALSPEAREHYSFIMMLTLLGVVFIIMGLPTILYSIFRKEERKGVSPVVVLLILIGIGTVTTVTVPPVVDSVMGEVIDPRHPAYGIERFGEEEKVFIMINIVRNRVGGARLLYECADERIKELRICIDYPEHVRKLVDEYDSLMDRVREQTTKAEEEGLDIEEVLELVEEKTLVHKEVLEDLLERCPPEARDDIEEAIERSMKGHEEAIEALKRVRKRR